MESSARNAWIGTALAGSWLAAREKARRDEEDVLTRSVKSTGRAYKEDGVSGELTPTAKKIVDIHKQATGTTGQRIPVFQEKGTAGGAYDYKHDSFLLGDNTSNYVLAHELGHREMEKNPGIMQTVQKKFYQPISPLIRNPALAALGYFSPSARRAVAFGLAGTYLTEAGTLATEHTANKNAIKYLDQAGISVDKSVPRQQLPSYVTNIAKEALLPLAIGRLARVVQNPHAVDYVKATTKTK